MKEQAYIKLVGEDDSNYKDLDNYGITLVRGWREALLTPAGIKSIVTNDNRLEHGTSIIANTSCIRKDKRDVTISFFLEGTSEEDYLQKYENFLNIIAYSGQFCLKVPCLKRVFKLVYSSCSKYGDYGLKRSNFTLKLTEYNPNDREVI